MKKSLSFIFVFIIGWNIVEGFNPEPVVGIFTMTANPFLYNFDEHDFYKNKPSKIVRSVRERDGLWKIDTVKDISYSQDIQKQGKITKIKKYDKLMDTEDYYSVHYQFNGDNLVSMIVRKGEEDRIINRKYIDYTNERMVIRVYKGTEEELNAKYICQYNEKGLLESYIGESNNPFSEKWEEDYSYFYLYDDQKKVTKIFYGSDRSSSTDIVYDEDDNITTGSGNNMYRAEYDADGRLIYQKWLFPPGGEVDEEIKTYDYSEGKIVRLTNEVYYSGELMWSAKYELEY